MDRTEDRCPDPRIIRRFSSTQLIPGAPSAGPLMSSRVADDYKQPKAADALISTNSRRVCVPVPTLAVYLSINSAGTATNGAISAHVGSATLVPQPLSSDRSDTQPRQKGKSAADRRSRLNSRPGRTRRDHRQPDDGGSTTSGIRCGELTRSIPTFITDVTFRLTRVRQLGACGPEESTRVLVSGSLALGLLSRAPNASSEPIRSDLGLRVGVRLRSSWPTSAWGAAPAGRGGDGHVIDHSCGRLGGGPAGRRPDGGHTRGKVPWGLRSATVWLSGPLRPIGPVTRVCPPLVHNNCAQPNRVLVMLACTSVTPRHVAATIGPLGETCSEPTVRRPGAAYGCFSWVGQGSLGSVR